MEKTFSTQELTRFECFLQHDGTTVVLLRKNIEKDVIDEPNGTGTEFWKADEVQVVTDMTEEEIEENFDALWYRAEREEMTDAQWREDIESTLLDLMEVIA